MQSTTTIQNHVDDRKGVDSPVFRQSQSFSNFYFCSKSHKIKLRALRPCESNFNYRYPATLFSPHQQQGIQSKPHSENHRTKKLPQFKRQTIHTITRVNHIYKNNTTVPTTIQKHPLLTTAMDTFSASPVSSAPSPIQPRSSSPPPSLSPSPSPPE